MGFLWSVVFGMVEGPTLLMEEGKHLHELQVTQYRAMEFGHCSASLEGQPGNFTL